MRHRSPASCARPNAVIWEQVGVIPFALGALMFSVLLYQSRLVPRWLSAWGLVGAVLYVVPALGSMFGLSLGFLMAPLALQEMVLAAWLIAKGFSPSAIAVASAGAHRRGGLPPHPLLRRGSGPGPRRGVPSVQTLLPGAGQTPRVPLG